MEKRIASRDALNALRDQARKDVELRTGEQDMRLTIHMGTCGIAAGARDVLAQVMRELAEAGAQGVSVRQSGCAGLCDQEPMLTITTNSGQQYRYGRLTPTKVHEIVHNHVLGGEPVTAYLVQA